MVAIRSNPAQAQRDRWGGATMNELTALRDTWEFRYKASEVHTAAMAKVAHHSKRVVSRKFCKLPSGLTPV